MLESKEPIGAASPIGKRFSGYNFVARYERGILAAITEIKLWMKHKIDFW